MIFRSIIGIFIVVTMVLAVPINNVYGLNDIASNSPNEISDNNTSGKIILEQNDFKLYGGSLLVVPIFVEMNDFIHAPTLTIFHNENLINTIYPRFNGDTSQSFIALNSNWDTGVYEIKLNHQNKILDTFSFLISTDNELVTEKIIDKNMLKVIDPYILVKPSKVFIESHSNEKISITGVVDNFSLGYTVNIEILTPDNEILTRNVHSTSEGFFSDEILISKNWIAGEYQITGQYLDSKIISTTFIVKNNWNEIISDETNLVGSFDLSSEISNNYTIL